MNVDNDDDDDEDEDEDEDDIEVIRDDRIEGGGEDDDIIGKGNVLCELESIGNDDLDDDKNDVERGRDRGKDSVEDNSNSD